MFQYMTIQQHEWNNLKPPSHSVQTEDKLHLFRQILEPVHTTDYQQELTAFLCSALESSTEKSSLQNWDKHMSMYKQNHLRTTQ